MRGQPQEPWHHTHDFGLHEVRSGERRTLIVVVLTTVFMVAEVGGGLLSGSMALLADGLHMASHAVALGISLGAYVYARRRAWDGRFSFGVGKVNALGGFSGALLLALFALGMMAGSVERLIRPGRIDFGSAIPIAIVGLLVNVLSVFILGGDAHDEHEGHAHDDDHNLRAAYLHVLADALTSITAILALCGAKYFGWTWLDAAMGIVGAMLVSRWSWGLLRETSHVLLDQQAPDADLARIRASIEEEGGDRVADLHVWSIGPGLRAACLSVVSDRPAAPDAYKRLLPADLGLAHVTVEVHRGAGGTEVPPRS
jgi:cation diffusion facilitator family transporter